MTASNIKAVLYGSLVAVGLSGLGVSQQVQASSDKSPAAIVQAFLNTMEYQYLSDEDKAVWDEQTWNQLQESSLHANQTRLPSGHEYYELEKFVREFVEIEAVSYERAEDGSSRVTAQTSYPTLLILVDDYAETESSSAYEQLASYQARFESGELSADNIDLYVSEMPWRVSGGGVYVNAAQMQENMEELQAQSGW